MKFILLCFLTFITLYSYSQNQIFPNIEGNTLEDKPIEFPADAKGKVTLIAIAYSKKSDDYLKDWLVPVYRNFINPPQSSFIPIMPYDVNIFFIALLKGIAKTAKGKIESNLNKNLDPEYYSHTVISKSEFKPIRDALRFGKKDLPYFFVVDPQGAIVYQTEGAYSNSKMQEIVDQVDKHSKR
ncbi:MAG: hypothetical protein O2887_16220 [Bacteroidetes bacterium]|nr:hypothetical protein [Bacteroidota bacterium]MDA1122009.1 hypothetical protein [Bacteroidota bacterium]